MRPTLRLALDLCHSAVTSLNGIPEGVFQVVKETKSAPGDGSTVPVLSPGCRNRRWLSKRPPPIPGGGGGEVVIAFIATKRDPHIRPLPLLDHPSQQGVMVEVVMGVDLGASFGSIRRVQEDADGVGAGSGSGASVFGFGGLDCYVRKPVVQSPRSCHSQSTAKNPLLIAEGNV